MDDRELAADAVEGLVHCNTLHTQVAGYRYRAATTAVAGEPVRLVREPDNPADPNAIVVHDAAGRLLGYLFREIAQEYAPLVDHGCVRLEGRLVGPGEPGYDPSRQATNPALYVAVYADEARLAEVVGQPA